MNPYIPQKLPLEHLDWERLSPLIGQANHQLGHYAGLLSAMLNPDIFLSPLGTQEAVLSSRIEGTQATLEEVLRYEATTEAPEGKLADIEEVINYRRAMQCAVARMAVRPSAGRRGEVLAFYSPLKLIE